MCAYARARSLVGPSMGSGARTESAREIKAFPQLRQRHKMTENRREELLQQGVVIEVDGRCESLSYVSSMGIYSCANVYSNAVVGLTEVVTELVRLKAEVTELRKVGILITLKQQTPSLHAVGCAGSGERGCRGGRR